MQIVWKLQKIKNKKKNKTKNDIKKNEINFRFLWTKSEQSLLLPPEGRSALFKEIGLVRSEVEWNEECGGRTKVFFTVDIDQWSLMADVVHPVCRVTRTSSSCPTDGTTLLLLLLNKIEVNYLSNCFQFLTYFIFQYLALIPSHTTPTTYKYIYVCTYIRPFSSVFFF